MHENSYYNLHIKFKSFLKLRKMFPRFPSFRICPNAKYENLEISEISLTLLFCSETVKESMKTVTTIASHTYKIQIIPEAEKNLSEISEFSNFPDAENENSEISLTYSFALKQSRNA